MENVNKYIVRSLKETSDVMNLLINDIKYHNLIGEVANVSCEALNKGGKIMLAGNGGSAGDKSLVITATLNGTSTLSPVIDLNRCSVTTVANRLNDATTNSAAYNSAANGRTYIADTVSSGTSNANRYVTKRVDLNNEADILDVFINANKPSGANIDLFFKVLEAGSDADFDSLPWILQAPDSPIITNDGGAYNEVHYTIDPTIGKFGSFAFKIVLRSTNTSNVPTVKDFRAVAAT